MQGASIVRTVLAEVAHYPGVAHEVKEGGKHKRIVFTKGEESRFLTVPRTPSDWRAGQNAIRDFKKTMIELGAQRLEAAPAPRKYRNRKGGPIARFMMNDKLIVLHIPKASKLLSRFMTKNRRPTAHWQFELRASPDLTAPPMLAVRKAEVRAGRKVQTGLVGGFFVTGAWRLTIARNAFPVLSNKATTIPTTALTLYEDKGDELVFRLPPGTIPTGFTKHPAPAISPPPGPKPSEAWPEVLPVPQPAIAKAPAPVVAPAPAPAIMPPQTMTLQFPKQTVSVEQAIGILNKAKQRLGNNLRFTIVEDGYLTAVHRIGS